MSEIFRFKRKSTTTLVFVLYTLSVLLAGPAAVRAQANPALPEVKPHVPAVAEPAQDSIENLNDNIDKKDLPVEKTQDGLVIKSPDTTDSLLLLPSQSERDTGASAPLPLHTKDEAIERAYMFLQQQNTFETFPKDLPIFSTQDGKDFFAFLEQAREAGIQLVTSEVIETPDRYRVRFGLRWDGIRILGEELEVILDKPTGQVTAVSGNLHRLVKDDTQNFVNPVRQAKYDLIITLLDEHATTTGTWDDAISLAEKVYYVVPDKEGEIRQGYLFEAELLYPFGVWQYLRDATTGRSIWKKNTTLLLNENENSSEQVTGSGTTIPENEVITIVPAAPEVNSETSDLPTSEKPEDSSPASAISDFSGLEVQTLLSGFAVSDKDLLNTLLLPLPFVQVFLKDKSEPLQAGADGSIAAPASRIQTVKLDSKQVQIINGIDNKIPQIDYTALSTGSGSNLPERMDSPVLSATSFALADTNAYYYAQHYLDEISRMTGITSAKQIQLFVNSRLARENGQHCTAFSLPTRYQIHFGSSEGCPGLSSDLALSPDVIYHEMTHILVEGLHPFSETTPEVDWMREGISDGVAAILNQDPLIGETVFKDPLQIDRFTSQPCTGSSDIECPDGKTTDTHTNSRLISSALWELYQKIGRSETLALLFSALQYETNTLDALVIHLLLEDDSRSRGGDNDMLNGTPHAQLILETFHDRGIGPGYLKWRQILTTQPAMALDEKWWKTESVYSERLHTILDGQHPETALVKQEENWVFSSAKDADPASAEESTDAEPTTTTEPASENLPAAEPGKTALEQNPEAIASLTRELEERQKIQTIFGDTMQEGFVYQIKNEQIHFIPQFLQNEVTAGQKTEEGNLVFADNDLDVLYQYDSTSRRLKEVLAIEKLPQQTADSTQLTVAGTESTMTGSGSLIESDQLTSQQTSGSGSILPDFVEKRDDGSRNLRFSWTVERDKSHLIKSGSEVFVRDEFGNDLLKIEAPFYLDKDGQRHDENIRWNIGGDETEVSDRHTLTLEILNPDPDSFPILVDPTVINDWSFVDQNASSGLNYDATKEAQFPQLVDFQGALYAIWRETNSAGDSHIRAKRFNGNSWVFVDGGGGNGLNFDVIRDALSPHAVVFGNALYVTWWEQTASVYQIRVKKYDGTTWSFVDGGGATGINQNTARNAYRPSLTVYNGLLYNTWSEENASAVLQIRVKKYDGVSWTTADGGGANGINQDTTKSAERSSLTVYGTMLYNIWIEPNGSGVDQIRVKKYDGVSWTTADGGGANGINQDTGRNVTFENPFMVPSGIYLYATWAEQNPSGISQIRVKQYDGTSWISVDGGGVNGLNYDTARNADGTNLQHFNNTLFLGWKETDAGGIDHVHVKRYSSGSWIFVDGGDSTGLNISSITNAREPRMALFGNALYLGVEEESSSLVYQIRVRKYDGNTWYLVDSPISSGTQNTGWLNLTTCSNNTGTGTAAWGTTANALASDNAYSSATLGASVTSNYLVCTTPSGVSIPSGAGITGIEVNVERSSSSGAVGVNILDNAVYLVKNNVILDNLNKAQATVWTTGDTVITYGNSADLWQNTWKVSDFSGAFGVAFSAKNTGTVSANGRVDHIQIRIHYTQDFDKGLNKDATKDAYNPEFATYNSDLYATWYEHNASSIGQIRLARYDGIQWTFVDGNGTNGLNIDVSKDAQSPHLAVYNGLLYVTWSEADSVSSIQQIRVGAFDGSGWEILDGGGVTGLNVDVSSPAYTPRFQVYNDQIFLLWSEHFTDTIDGPVYHIRAKASDGIDNWYQVEPGNGINQDNFYSGEFPHMAVYNDTLYAIWTESNLTDSIKLIAKQYNNDETWSLTNDIAGLQQSGGYTYPSNPDLASYDGYLYAIWSQTNASLSAQHIRVKRYDGTTWSSFDTSNTSVVYIADTSNNRIQRCRPNTTCTVYASAGASLGQVNAPQGVAVYNYDTVYIADTTNNRIQKCTGSTPTCALYAGAGTALGQVNGPEAIAVDSSGAVYIADRSNNRVQRCTGATPTCTLYAGSGTALGQVNLPEGIAVDQNGVVYIADTGNNRVQRCTAAATCTQYLAAGTSLGQTSSPKGIATDSSGNVYVSDTNIANRVQYCTAASTCTLYAASGTALGTVNASQGLMADNVGGLYIADTGNNRVQYCTAASTCTQFAGAGTSPGQVNSPRDVDFASSGINYDVTRSGAKPRLVVFGDKLVAAWTEHNGSFFQMRMKYFDGTAWYTADDNTSQNYSTLRGSDSPALVVYKSFVYAGWYEGNGTANQIRVKKYDGKSWLSSDGNGTTGLNFNTSNTPVSPQFTEYNNKLYATWVEDSGGSVYQVRVKRYDGNGIWTFVDGGGSTGLNYNTAQSALGANGTASQLAVFNNQLFLIWSEFNTTGSVNQIRVKKYDGTSWTNADSGTVGINQNTSRYAYYPHLAVYGNELYAAWSEAVTAGPAQYNIRVKKTSNGSTWTSVDGGAATGLNKDTTKEAFYPQLIVFGDKLYSIWQEQNGTGVWQSRVRRYDSGSSWTFVDGNGANGINTNTASDAIFPQLVVYQNQMYAAWSEFNASIYQVRVRKYGPTANTWTTVDGGTTTTGLNFDTTKNANAPRMAVFDNRLFITWHESAGSFDLVRLKYFNGSTWYNAENGSTGINYDTTRDAQRPKLTIFGRKLYAIWREHNGTNYQVRVKELTNESYINVSLPSDTINFGTLTYNTLYNSYSTTLQVETNAANGFQVYVSDNQSGSNSALQRGMLSSYIPDYPSAIASPTQYNSCASPPCYGLGICVVSATGKNTSTWGSGISASDSNNKYAAVPQADSLIHSAPAGTISDEVVIGYGLKHAFSQTPGVYSGIITYTVVAVP